MKLLTTETMRELERRAMANGIASLDLMERAGVATAAAIVEHFAGSAPRSLLIVAGKGNNGGDGFVVARLLAARGWEVTVLLLAEPLKLTGDAAVNLARLPVSCVIPCPDLATLHGEEGRFKGASVIVDALFGTGLKSELRGVEAEAIALMDASGRPVVSVDIPSGVDASTGRVLGVAVRAALTVTFAAAKLGHLLYPGAELTGQLQVADIGIPRSLMDAASGVDLVDHQLASTLIRPRRPNAHKGELGHCLIIAGSTGKSGAAALAANSAVRGGAGLVTLAAPATLNPVLEIKTTEAMTFPLSDGGRGYLDRSVLPVIEELLIGKRVVAIGPGLGWQSETAQLVQALIRTVPLPLVIDADGLNALSEDLSALQDRRSPAVILTPHPGEMARLAGCSVSEVNADRLGIASSFARTNNVYLILKGARTVIASPDGGVAINGSGNPGMASGGMGDVLTGLLSALLSQGYDPLTVCRLGVFVHGYAGDLVAKEKGEMGLCASDLQERLPYAIYQLLSAALPI
jgi:NAD(P)H-hydrate epimerase